MSRFPATKARRVLAALLRIGWVVKRQSGSHRTLSRSAWTDVVWPRVKESCTGRYLKELLGRRSANGLGKRQLE